MGGQGRLKEGKEVVGVLPVVQYAMMTHQLHRIFLEMISGSAYYHNVRFGGGFVYSHPPSLPTDRALLERLTTGSAVMLPPPQWHDRCVGCHDALHDRALILFIKYDTRLH